MAQAISYLHKQGFLHRDIKADNVLISHVNNEYRAILIDFGKCVALTAVGSLVKHFAPEEQKLYKSKHGHIAPELSVVQITSVKRLKSAPVTHFLDDGA